MARVRQKAQEHPATGSSRLVRTGVYYRCPGCGEEVDQTSRIAVAQHHQHVINPHLFLHLQRRKESVG